MKTESPLRAGLVRVESILRVLTKRWQQRRKKSGSSAESPSMGFMRSLKSVVTLKYRRPNPPRTKSRSRAQESAPKGASLLKSVKEMCSRVAFIKTLSQCCHAIDYAVRSSNYTTYQVYNSELEYVGVYLVSCSILRSQDVTSYSLK